MSVATRVCTGFDFILHLYFLIRYSKTLEEGRPLVRVGCTDVMHVGKLHTLPYWTPVRLL